ncbi:hypothetical protein [Siansivirga zeaxanthinifaciens]|uniref:Uncharacterized protein n=1 Tax=Siansivirga zeaxanthinifaciens CC-SAMT-1 TaxID=1454006 RepID=A0A0C5W0Q2_9FLAO|nr:hypothetical protein [Siansivirga zeaxanthinifaciens]AJR04916.1 hypothetical protein AW14_09650 [Siansivirga zeaxanthinifaciens CC-SAMT-1]
MKKIFRTFILTILLFSQVGISQENENWIKGTIFTKTDTISGFIKSNSISNEGIKFKKDLDSSMEFLTPDLIDRFDINDNIYEKVFIKSFGNYGEYKFGKLMLSGMFNLFLTSVKNYSAAQTSIKEIYILNFNDKTIKLSLNAFSKLKDKKKIAKELEGYDELKNIILKKDFDFNVFFDEIQNLNSDKKNGT